MNVVLVLLIAEEWKHETVCTVSQQWNNKLGS